ncbi:hypothetical protein [Stenotrophomonas maltophilia]|uniref:hypothetical protein n=1 Tax=Stenotrophomonas maltophilia TaxID=40324 RepID=UPI0006AC2313|nr:hypothetical protein [Stenotrophomonas maltophilia]KOQ71163.1 hypothetical protein ABW44_17685 [Stenotrophomonas maltophilia]
MTSRIFIGLSGPTFYDYQNTASQTRNDGVGAPNPILENSLALTVFYDEIWFLCESLCPQSLRGHPSTRYLDQEIDKQPTHVQENVRSALKLPPDYGDDSMREVISRNFDEYWPRAENAGAYWWNSKGRRIDNHTRPLDILGVHCIANSNSPATLATDIAIHKALEKSLPITLSLNSFSQELFAKRFPTQFHPTQDDNTKARTGSFVINAMVDNCVSIQGPDPMIFDHIATNDYTKQFRRYIAAKNIEDAARSYLDVTAEIRDATAKAIRGQADQSRVVKGLTSIFVDVVIDFLGIGTYLKASKWIYGLASPPPISAAAFILDLQEQKATGQNSDSNEQRSR